MTLTVADPATKETIVELERAGVEETDAAVARARALETGVLSVSSNSSVRVATLFGGELGLQALEGYTEVENVFVSTEG